MWVLYYTTYLPARARCSVINFVVFNNIFNLVISKGTRKARWGCLWKFSYRLPEGNALKSPIFLRNISNSFSISDHPYHWTVESNNKCSNLGRYLWNLLTHIFLDNTCIEKGKNELLLWMWFRFQFYFTIFKP